MKKSDIKNKIREIKQEIEEIDKEIHEQYEHLDDTPWEVPGLTEAEMRKKIYEKKLQTLEDKLGDK